MRIQEALGIIASRGLLYTTVDRKIIKMISRAGTTLFDVSGPRPERLQSEAEIERAYAFYELEGLIPEGPNSLLVYLKVEEGDHWSPEMVNCLNQGKPVGYDMGSMPGSDTRLGSV